MSYKMEKTLQIKCICFKYLIIMIAVFILNDILISNAFANNITVNLVVNYKTVNFAGKNIQAIAVNNQIPAPTLHFKEGDTVTLNVYNHLNVGTAIHWHGLIVPWQMDGVEEISQRVIPQGSMFSYHFTLYQSGTYWYHAHAGFQEQQGFYGAFIIDPSKPPPYKYDKDYVIVLSDWSNTKPTQIFANLKKDGDYYSPKFPLQSSLVHFIQDYRKATPEERKQLIDDYKMMQEMRMSIYDFSDVAYDAFLLNGQPSSQPWTAPIKVGDVVRLRFIGAGGSTIFHVKITGTTMQMVHVEGNDVRPYNVNDFTVAPGETYDVLVKIQKDAPYIIYAESTDTLGAAIGALVTNPNQIINYQAVTPFPEPEPVTREMMANMMSGMNHSAMTMNANSSVMTNHAMPTTKKNNPPTSNASSATSNAMDMMPGMDHSSMNMNKESTFANNNTNTKMKTNAPSMKVSSSKNMISMTSVNQHDMNSMSQTPMTIIATNHANHSSISSMTNMQNIDTSSSVSSSMSMNLKNVPNTDEMSKGQSESMSNMPTSHDMAINQMNNDMSMNHSMNMPTEPTIIGDTISSPNSYQATTSGTKYQNLVAAVKTNDTNKPIAGIIRMQLFGYMDRYIWFINGQTESQAKPIIIEPGKRYRIIFTNDSMMHHPMHIHGHWFILRNGNGVYDPLLHTIDVAPGATVVADIDADASGQWFFHCHHLYHMMTGMARVFQYSTIIDIAKGTAQPQSYIQQGSYANRPIIKEDEVTPIDPMLINHPMGHPAGLFMASFLDVGEDPFENAQQVTFKGLYGGDFNKLELFSDDAEIIKGNIQEADMDIFYWHLISQFWAIKGGMNYTYRPSGTPYWQPGIGIEGLMPYFIDTNMRTYYHDGSESLDVELSRDTQITNNFFIRTAIRSILATNTVTADEIGSGLNQMRYIIRPYYRLMPGLNLFTEFEHDSDYGVLQTIVHSNGEPSSENILTVGVSLLF